MRGLSLTPVLREQHASTSEHAALPDLLQQVLAFYDARPLDSFNDLMQS